MNYPIAKMGCRECSILLSEIPDPPKEIYVRGNLPPEENMCLAVVGSRNYTNYGKQVVEYLISGLRSYPISIISGLALGIDTLAHEAALTAGLHTLAVPGSGIDDSVIYPRRNFGLAQKILESAGGLLSEFEPDFRATQWSFPQRNRIMAGLSHAVLLIEASEKSGTLITARLTAEYNRDLLVVPGNIFSENSYGVHQFLKLGAIPVTTPADIIDALHLTRDESEDTEMTLFGTPDEILILEILTEPKDHDSIIRSLPLTRETTLTLLMKMELDGRIKEQGGIFFKV
jgi:DNA processing protein